MRQNKSGRYQPALNLCAKHGRDSSRETQHGTAFCFYRHLLLGDIVAIVIAYAVEQFSEQISLFVFLFLFVGAIPVAWRIAVRVTEPKSAATSS